MEGRGPAVDKGPRDVGLGTGFRMSTKQERLQVIDAAVFRTITSEDWARALHAARRAENAISKKIAKILEQKQSTKKQA